MTTLNVILLLWALVTTALLFVTLLGAADVVDDNKHLQAALRDAAATLPRDHNGTGSPIHDRLAQQRLRREIERWDRQAGR